MARSTIAAGAARSLSRPDKQKMSNTWAVAANVAAHFFLTGGIIQIVCKRMEIAMDYLICYVILINIVTFLIYLIDKKKAEKDKWRIGERTLLLLAVIGGSIGALLAMHVARHKTKKNRFRIGIPVILIIQAGLLIWAWSRMGAALL